jgi:hypothetical protein
MTALPILLAMTALLPGTIQDPFQHVANKALNGEYGVLKDWQFDGYTLGLARGTKADTTVWLTCYYATEGRDGQIDRRGRKCTMRTAAATSIKENAYVWCWPPGELRQIRDTGSRRNDRVARRKGADRWIDYWYPSVSASAVRGGSAIAKCAIIGRPED